MERPAPSRPSSSPSATSSDVRKVRVLLCDDVEPLLLAAQTFLGKRLPGVEVLAVRSADEALHIMDAGRCDVVVTDYHLQGMNGIDLCLRLHLRHPEMALALMSAYTDIPLSLAGLGAIGIDCFIQKPLNPVALTQVVRYMANARPRTRAAVRASGALHVSSEMAGDEASLPASEQKWCLDGHANPSSSRFCGECGKSLPSRRQQRYEPHEGDEALALAFRDHIRDERARALYDRGIRRMKAPAPARPLERDG